MQNFWILLSVGFRYLKVSLVQCCGRTACSPPEQGWTQRAHYFPRAKSRWTIVQRGKAEGNEVNVVFDWRAGSQPILQSRSCGLQLSCLGKAGSGNFMQLPLALPPELATQCPPFFSAKDQT